MLPKEGLPGSKKRSWVTYFVPTCVVPSGVADSNLSKMQRESAKTEMSAFLCAASVRYLKALPSSVNDLTVEMFMQGSDEPSKRRAAWASALPPKVPAKPC